MRLDQIEINGIYEAKVRLEGQSIKARMNWVLVKVVGVGDSVELGRTMVAVIFADPLSKTGRGIELVSPMRMRLRVQRPIRK